MSPRVDIQYVPPQFDSEVTLKRQITPQSIAKYDKKLVKRLKRSTGTLYSPKHCAPDADVDDGL